MQKEKNPLRSLSRLELIELLARQEREMQNLRQQLAEKEEALAQRAIMLEKAGSIAEASLALNGVFEAAQRAVEQYLENVERLTRASFEARAAKKQAAPEAASPEERAPDAIPPDEKTQDRETPSEAAPDSGVE